jgi:hypothetical protein
MKTATDHLWASTKNLAAVIGDVLTPANGLLVESAANVIDKLVEQSSESDILMTISDTLGQVLQDVVDILDPLLTEALALASSLLDMLSDTIERYVQPILEVLADVLDTVADAMSTLIGYVQSAVTWFDNFTDSVHEAIDALTFWNDTYDPNAATPSQVVDELPSATRHGRAAAATPTVNITVQTGVGDPHAIAREIRRLLAQDAARMGRLA